MKILVFFLFNVFIYGQNIIPLQIKINSKTISFFKNHLEKNLQKEKICKDILLDYSIINKSNINYAIVIDRSKFLIYESNNFEKYLNPNLDILRKQMFQPAILIKSDNEITNTGYSDEGYYFKNLNNINNIINNNIIIVKANSEYRVKAKISLPINNNNISNGIYSQQIFVGISLEGKSEGLLSIILKQDSLVIKNNLKQKFKKIFKKNKILLYDGIISSNEIPVIIK